MRVFCPAKNAEAMSNTLYVFIKAAVCIFCLVTSCSAARKNSTVNGAAETLPAVVTEEPDAAETAGDIQTDVRPEEEASETERTDIHLPEPQIRVDFSQKERNKHRARAVNMMAAMYEAHDESGKAVQALRQCIALSPSNPYYYEKLGLMLAGSGSAAEQKEGYGMLEKAASRGSENGDIYFMLGEYFRKNGDPDKMTAYFERFISLSPSLKEQAAKADLLYRKRGFSLRGYEEQKKLLKLKISYQQLENVYQKKKDVKNHARVLSALSAISDPYKIGLAFTYMNTHEFQKALKAVNSIENVYDLDEQRFGDFVHLNSALCTVPGFLPADVRKGIYSSVTNNMRVYLSIKGSLNSVLLAGISFCSRSGNKRDIAEFIDKLVARPVDPDTVAGAVLTLVRSGQREAGLSLIENIEKQWGKGMNKGLSVLKGGLLSAAGRTEEARKYIDDMISAAAGDISADLYGKTAHFLTDMECFKEAEYFFGKCLEKEPDSTAFVSGYAYALYRKGQVEKAFSMLDSFLRKRPEGSAEIENLYGYLLVLEKKDLPKAVRLIGKALDRDPDNAAYLDSIGWAYFTSGNMEKAEQYLLQAASKSENEEIYDHCGDFFYAAGKHEKARKFWIDSYLLRQNEAVKAKIRKVNRQLAPDRK